MTEIGKLNTLRVVKELDFGVYLDGAELGEILMPTRYVPENCKIDDMVEVFIYLDSEDRIIATTQIPNAMVGQFAGMEVVSVNEIGAFLDWGLQKDLLVPFREQKVKMEEGKTYVVYVYFDEESNRIAASAKLDQFLDLEQTEYDEGQEVDLLIYNQTDMGFKAIVNNINEGVLYGNEVFQPLHKGQRVKGFIKKIRDDGKLDLCMQKPGYEKVDELSDRIFAYLEKNDGFLNVTDKTPADVITQMFNVSKKTFKKAVGSLYRKKLIKLEPDGIALIGNDIPEETV
jgi:predicted RNA-binding protein (virulence factor B family)